MQAFKQVFAVATVSVLAMVGAAHAAEDKSWPIDEVMGKADAPITVIEYASLGCPHCAEFAEVTLPRFKTEWIDTGKAKLIYRDFPLDARSTAAAMVAHCAGNDRYFAFLDTFYGSQRVWAAAEDGMAAIKNIARLGGITPDKVDACMQDQNLLQQIQARKDDATTRYNVDSTPSFVVDGKTTPGALSYDDLVKLLK